MPVPVPPPTPPPIVDILPAKDFSQSALSATALPRDPLPSSETATPPASALSEVGDAQPPSFFAARASAREARQLTIEARQRVTQRTAPSSQAIALQPGSQSGTPAQPAMRSAALGAPLAVGRSLDSPSPSYLPTTLWSAPPALSPGGIAPDSSRLDSSIEELITGTTPVSVAEPFPSVHGRSLTEEQQQAAERLMQQRFDRLLVTQDPLPVLEPLTEPLGIEEPLLIRPIPVPLPDQQPTEDSPENSETPASPAAIPVEPFPSLPNPEDTPFDPDRQILTIPPLDDTAPTPATEQPPAIDPAATSPDPNAPSDGVTGQENPIGTGEILEVDADRQEFDTLREVFQADGTVEMRFRQAVLTADRLRVNLPNRIAVADGNVVLTRGDQVIRGDRLEYSFVQGEGTVFDARGEIFLPTSSTDLTITPTPDGEEPATPPTPAPGLPPVYSPGGIRFDFGTQLDQGIELAGDKEGELTRFRFEAEQIDFSADGWTARNVELTNDPFSPPEFVLRTRQLTYTRLNPFQAELRARNPRLVFDGGLNLPLLRDRILIDSRRRNPNPIQFAFDDQVGGLYLQRPFEIISTPRALFTLSPALLIQRAIVDNGGNFFDPSSFGLVGALDLKFSPNTSLLGTAVFTSLDLSDLEETFRGSLRLRQRVNIGGINHRLSLEASYRDRLFNGSLGYQNVQSSLGAVFSSPNIPLGISGINLSYQASAQVINANTNREDLLDPVLERTNNRVTLGRFQATAALSRAFLLWSGTPLPPTPDAGLRYTPNPLVPNLVFVAIARGTVSHYTSDDTQATLTGTVVLQGQFGHFSRDFLDYTAFNIGYTQTAISGESPFNFDRIADPQVLFFGLVQQIYGPFRAGFQSSINLDNSEGFDTDFILEYSRRTYAIILRFNPDREVGSLGIRISDFNWSTPPEPFSGVLDERIEGNTVQGGVQPAGN